MNTEEIRKKTSHMGELVIRLIPKPLARELIIKGHYSHKWLACFGLYNYGIFRAGEESDEQCLGVASYGYMKNPKACIFESAVPGGWMIELNRMWIDDALGHNAETILIGASLKLLRRADPTIVAVQSFADGRLGCGTIYKASNFRYYGYLWTTFHRNRRSGEITADQCRTNISCVTAFLRMNIEHLIGDLESFRVKTYRYIYPLHKSFRFTAAKEQPYPIYEKGATAVEVGINPERLRPRIISALDTVLARWRQKYGSGPPRI